MPENKSVTITKYLHPKANTIGVMVHELDSYFITSALKGMGQVLTEQGFELIITHSQENSEKERMNARLLLDRKVDGVIASLSADTSDFSHFELFTENHIPVVFFDRVEQTGKNDLVVIDNGKCGFMATEHLIRQGCRRIAIVTSDLKRNVYHQRYEGFREALSNFKIPYTDQLLILGGIHPDSGVEAAKRIMQMTPMPDGLFITNDLVAAMCIHTLKEAGIRVPEDIAIVGFNNDPIARLISPSLTTIDYPGIEMGSTAATRLLHRLTNSRRLAHNTTTLVPSALIVRNSSQAPFLKRTCV